MNSQMCIKLIIDSYLKVIYQPKHSVKTVVIRNTRVTSEMNKPYLLTIYRH